MGSPPAYQPHSLFLIDGSCANITVTNLAFTTNYSYRYADGSHLKIFGHNITVNNCSFQKAPGFALVVGIAPGDTAVPYDIHIDSCSITNTYSDAIHVEAGNSVYLVGNTINGTGDDAIAVINDDYETSGPYYHLMATDIHILSNNIQYSGFRGIVIETATSGVVDSNVVDWNAYNDLEITNFGQTSNPAPSDCPQNITITNNSFFHAGWTPAHPTQNGQVQQNVPDPNMYRPYAMGVYLYNFNNATGSPVLVCSGNTVMYQTWDCVNIAGNTQNIEFGNSSYISNCGQPLNLGGGQQWYYAPGEPDPADYTQALNWDVSVPSGSNVTEISY